MRIILLRPGVMVLLLVLIFHVSCNGTPDANGIGTHTPKVGQTAPPPVNGERAIGYVKDIIAFGPRHAGEAGLEKTRQYIIEKLRSFGYQPKRHDFTAYTPSPLLKQVSMANLSVDIDGPGEKKILIGGHFDGKILEGVNFKGANDGGSSTALLLEIAKYFSNNTPPCDIRVAFFDGEEAIVKWTDMDSLYGSKNMATEMKSKGEEKTYAAAVIVDMIGDARLRVTDELSSTPWVFETLKNTANRLGYEDVFKGPRAHILDDHSPFQQIGIPAAVLIDLKYGPGWDSNSYWHTEKDDVDKISAKSIETVGHIVIESLEELLKGPEN